MCTEELAEYYDVSKQECTLVLHVSPGGSDYMLRWKMKQEKPL